MTKVRTKIRKTALLTVRLKPEQVDLIRGLDPKGRPCSFAYRAIVAAIEQYTQKTTQVDYSCEQKRDHSD